MKSPLNASYPVLPLRDIVVFPHMIVPLFVGRDKSVRALEEVMQEDKQILLSSQQDPSEDDPTSDQIYRMGVLANVLQLLKLPDGTVKVLVEGQSRVKINEFIDNPNFFEATAEYVEEDRACYSCSRWSGTSRLTDHIPPQGSDRQRCCFALDPTPLAWQKRGPHGNLGPSCRFHPEGSEDLWFSPFSSLG